MQYFLSLRFYADVWSKTIIRNFGFSSRSNLNNADAVGEWFQDEAYNISLWCTVVCCQTFHTPSFGEDDKQMIGDGVSSGVIDVDDDFPFADSPVGEEQVENIATLFMSCSPGRDSTEEEEDENDTVPLSKFYGVCSMSSCIWAVLCMSYLLWNEHHVLKRSHHMHVSRVEYLPIF